MAADYIEGLDEYFCSKYCDYQKIVAIEGYRVPDLIVIGKDGNISRRDSSLMKLSRCDNCAELLRTFKSGLADTTFSFGFSFPHFFDKIRDLFDKNTFSKRLPAVLAHESLTPQDLAGELTIERKIWDGIVKGKLYPEKSTVIAVALVGGLSVQDAGELMSVCGFSFEDDCVRDVVAEYLLAKKIFNRSMMRACLQEYRIENLPIRWTKENSDETEKNA